MAHTGAKYPRFWHDRKWNCPNCPVVGVCWYEAVAFAAWLTEAKEDGFRYFLPDEDQWEAAAAGFEGRKYPWGDEWGEGCCNSKEAGLERTTPVGIFETGNIIDEEFCDLSGNVWEWTCSNYHSNERLVDFLFSPSMHTLYIEFLNEADENRKEEIRKIVHFELGEEDNQLSVTCGASWYNKKERIKLGELGRKFAYTQESNFGFRCARSLRLLPS